jgi:hypothetical protein
MRLAALAILCLLTSSAADAAAPKVVAPPTPAATADGLRGPLGAVAKPAPISLIKPASLPPERIAGLTPHDALDRAECRRACSHTYFFCLQSDGAADCPQNWTSCLGDCSHPSRPLPSHTE